MIKKVLGKSDFNCKDNFVNSIWFFFHAYQQISYVLKINPKKILEIGPGDHHVTDFLFRKGYVIKTLDNDPQLFPDYCLDIREKLQIDEKFDLILASEVLEHVKFKYLDVILKNFDEILEEDAYLIISLPYSTIRLFPSRNNFGRLVSCEGRLFTHIPYYVLQPIISIYYIIQNIVLKKQGLKQSVKLYGIPEYPDNKFNCHHWDLGFYPTTRRIVRNQLKKHFKLIEEKVFINTNCVFFILQKMPTDPKDSL